MRFPSALLGMASACLLLGCASSSPAWNPLTDTPTTRAKGDVWKQQTSGRGRAVADGTAREPFHGSEQIGTGQFTDNRPLNTIVIPGRTRTGGDGVTLNIVNVPLVQAAKAVLGDMLGANYTVADRLGGNITIQTTTAIPREVLVDIFESALKANGAALVRGEGHYRIVPLAGAVSAGLSLTTPGRAASPGMGLHVVVLQFVSASEMRRIVEPVAPPGSVVRVDDARGLLVLAGSTRELTELIALTKLFDADWMKGMSVALYPVKSSDPEAIAKELESVMGLDRDSPMRGMVRVIPNRRLGAIMVTSTRPGPLETARTWIERLDRVAEGSEEQLFVYKVRNRNAGELANVLSRVLASRDSQGGGPNAGGTIAPRYEPATTTSDPATDSRGGAAASRAASIAGSVTSTSTGGTATPGYEPDRSTTAQPQQTGGRGQRVVADEPNSALLITATRKEYQRILQILASLDAMPTQVMLEAVIAEVTLNDELKFGLKWFFEKGNNKITLSDTTGGTIQANFPGFNYFFSIPSASVALDAISSVTKVNVVSAPSLMVLDNRKASLQIGDQVPIVTQTAQNTTTVGAPIINSITLKDTGIILNVTPRVSDSGRVVLDIEQEVSSVVRTTSSGIDSPTIQQRKLRTTAVVGDGEQVALGGLIQERNNDTKGQVPILGDIPVIGTAFRQKNDKVDRTELLIFIRPVVVRNIDQARDVTQEFRDRLQASPLTTSRGRNTYERDARRILQ